MNRFSKSSYDKLRGVRPELVAVATLALSYSPLDFTIIEGPRNEERQKQLVKEGKSQTMNSRHLHGAAVDFAVLLNGKITWDFEHYKVVAEAFKRASRDLNVPIVWGGDWKTLKDGPHVELDRAFYPDK